MNIRAVIFDIYNTLLAVGPPPADADARWVALHRKHFAVEPELSLSGFAARARELISREHAAARSAGVAFPEIYWPRVVGELIPALAKLSAEQRETFLHEHASLERAIQLAPGAGEVLSELRHRGLLLGIASNSQPYTLTELDTALATANLTRAIFAPDLCFHSFAHGFSKPDPHVFRLLTARLIAHGISPEEALMVGDREDNDIEPAQGQGWRTWQFTPEERDAKLCAGGWRELRAWLIGVLIEREGGFG